MPVSNSEEVAVLEATEVRDGDPTILVHLVGVARGDPSLSGEGKLGDAVGVHLLWV